MKASSLEALFLSVQALYDSEINFEISTFWDGGYTAKLGDAMNGFVAEKSFDCLPVAMRWLCNEAIAHYPDSEFARRARSSDGLSEAVNALRVLLASHDSLVKDTNVDLGRIGDTAGDLVRAVLVKLDASA